jgi:hypothetical protein
MAHSDFVSAKFKRIQDDIGAGVALTVKSEKIEKFMQSIAAYPNVWEDQESIEQRSRLHWITSYGEGWSNLLGYRLKSESELQDTILDMLWGWGGNDLGTLPNNPNIAILRARGLGKGATAKFYGPYTDKYLDKYLTAFNNKVKHFHDMFMKEIKLSGNITLSDLINSIVDEVSPETATYAEGVTRYSNGNLTGGPWILDRGLFNVDRGLFNIDSGRTSAGTGSRRSIN